MNKAIILLICVIIFVNYLLYKEKVMKILCIVGPTASGKTAFSIELATFINSLNKNGLGTTIINADSRQLYKDFPIITAQPNAQELSQANHRLYGILDIEEKTHLGFWLDKVHAEIENCKQNNIVPIFVGGTGMYIKALTEGIAQIPEIPLEVSVRLKEELQNNGIEHLYSRLKEFDPQYSAKIHFNDSQRILRALEVVEHTKKKLSDWHKEAHANSVYESFKIGVGMPLDELSPYLYKRTDIMLSSGALEEAKLALAINDDLSLASWSGIGCQELGMYLKNKISIEEACELWNKNTRAYAKRQWTWFRGDKSIHWLHPLDKEARKEAIDKAIAFLDL